MQDGRLWIGDNAAGGEIWLLRNKHEPRWNVEEAVSIRAVRRVYAEKAGIAFDDAPEPKDVYAIGRGEKPGPRDAAGRGVPSNGRGRRRRRSRRRSRSSTGSSS